MFAFFPPRPIIILIPAAVFHAIRVAQCPNSIVAERNNFSCIANGISKPVPGNNQLHRW